MKPYYPSIAAHTFIKHSVGVITQKYYPSIAAHSWPVISSTAPAPGSILVLPLSPQAEEFVATLLNPEDSSDDDLYNATSNAEAIMQLWQDEYFALDKQIAAADRNYVRRKDPRKRAQPQFEYQQIDEPSQQRARYRSVAPEASANEAVDSWLHLAEGPEEANPTATGPLTISMNVPDSSKVTGKRVRKPRTIFQGGDEPTLLLDPAAPSQPRAIKKRGREPTEDAATAPDQPTTKKRGRKPTSDATAPANEPTTKRLRLTTPAVAPPARSTRAKSIKKEESPAPDVEAKVSSKTKSRSEVMTAVWAKRQAEGKNGRHGGAPKEITKAKAGKK